MDGQFAVRKGLGIARIWWNGMDVDVSTSHLSTYTMSAMENLHERMVQTKETIDILRKSRADVKESMTIQGDPYGRGIVNVDSKFEVAFSCKVCLLPRPETEL